MLSSLLKGFEAFDEHAQLTECKRKGVAAVAFTIGENPNCIAVRYNGPVKGQACTGEKGRCGCAHSELRLIMAFARGDEDVRRYCGMPLILYTTYSACDFCAHLIVECGLFSGVIYRHFASHWPQGVRILQAAGLSVLSIAEIETAKAIEHLRPQSARIVHDTIERWQSPVRTG